MANLTTPLNVIFTFFILSFFLYIILVVIYTATHKNISFGLVNIPIVMNPIIKDNDTSFNQLHNKCLTRVKYVKYCPQCKKDLKESEIIKGYEYEKNNYLIFDKTELNTLKPEKDDDIEVVSFINLNEISPTYFEKSYFLSTENKSKSYLLFYEALKRTKLVALCKCIITSKFYYAILKYTKEGIIMTTLYFDEEVNIPDNSLKSETNEKELKLAVELIIKMKGNFEPHKYKDEYQDNIKKAINDKLNGKEIKKTKGKSKKQIDNLLKALEMSLKK